MIRVDEHLRFLGDFYGHGLPDIIGFGETNVVVAKTREMRHSKIPS